MPAVGSCTKNFLSQAGLAAVSGSAAVTTPRMVTGFPQALSPGKDRTPAAVVINPFVVVCATTVATKPADGRRKIRQSTFFIFSGKTHSFGKPRPADGSECGKLPFNRLGLKVVNFHHIASRKSKCQTSLISP
jgi:hypothetical protein